MIEELNFQKFLTEGEQDIEDTLLSLPKKHTKILDGLKIKYTCNNTLDFDKQHVGQIKNKKMIVSAPWNYSRQFTTLHEVAHILWCKILTNKQRKKWEKIVSETKLKTKEKNIEELFCMAYANYYSKHQLITYKHKEWEKFIKSI